MEWFVVHTQPRAEAKAMQHLRNQGFAVYLPRYLKRRRHARRIDWVATPLFPRYLFVGMDLLRARWRAIRSTVGVADLICSGDRPAPVPPAVLDAIRAREDERGLVSLADAGRFARGDKVRIAEGAFSGLVALFECMSDEDRVVLLLDLLGRQVRVEVGTEAVEALA
jgi:transcriptional antiterminator RfaH